LEERTAELLSDALDLLDRVSGERITRELELIFNERQPELALLQLERLGILETIHPGLVVDELFMAQVDRMRHKLAATPWAGTKPGPVHYLGLMSFPMARDEMDALVERLNLRSHQRSTLKQVYRIKRNAQKIVRATRASQLYRLLAASSDDARLIAWLALENETAQRQIIRFQRDLRDVAPLIDGHYLKEQMHLTPGPIFRDIFEALRDARLDAEVMTLADERALVEKIVAGHPDTQRASDNSSS
jgi:tRNA nucleotidyltransferase (CCA-adding enzyme)